MKKLSLLVLCVSCLCAQEQKNIVIVGGGLAGISAAIEAQRSGAHVLLLDKENDIGGNSKKASSGMNAACTSAQICKQIVDSPDSLMRDTLKSGNGSSNKVLVDVLAKESADAWQFLSDLGVDLSVISQTGGHSVARTHRAQQKRNDVVTNIGIDIIMSLSKYVACCEPDITVLKGARVSQLLKDEKGAIGGVMYVKDGKFYSVMADAVILATGGFCGRTGKNSLIAQYRPDLASLGTTNGNCANGDGIQLACSVGAEIVDMEKVQVHPTGFVHPHYPNELRKFLAPESLRAAGGILLNHKGQRFTNELGKRDEVTEDILTHCFPYCAYGERGPISAYLILNEAGAELFQKSVLDFYIRRGFVQQVANVDVLAEFIGSDREELIETLQNYNSCSDKGCDEFGKKLFPIKKFSLNEPLYVMIITPCLHYSMGGLKFNEAAQVIGACGPIKNLYAAGEVTGGLHGANRLCGNSLLECVVFGRRAGRNASSNAALK